MPPYLLLQNLPKRDRFILVGFIWANVTPQLLGEALRRVLHARTNLLNPCEFRVRRPRYPANIKTTAEYD